MNKILYKIIKKYYKIFTPSESYRKIKFGGLKGMNWIFSSGYPEYWMGDYEKKISVLFENYAKSSNIVYDIGANIGFYTLLASKSIAKDGKVYAFEPLPYNIKYLRKHVEINKLSNVYINESAVTNKSGEMLFSNGDNIVANTLCQVSPIYQNNKSIKVKVVSLDDLLEKGSIQPPDLMKMDIEGAELDALSGAQMLLKKYHPVIFLSTHNCHIKGIHQECCKFLLENGYNISLIDFYDNQTETEDPYYEILAEKK